MSAQSMMCDIVVARNAASERADDELVVVTGGEDDNESVISVSSEEGSFMEVVKISDDEDLCDADGFGDAGELWDADCRFHDPG